MGETETSVGQTVLDSGCLFLLHIVSIFTYLFAYLIKDISDISIEPTFMGESIDIGKLYRPTSSRQ